MSSVRKPSCVTRERQSVDQQCKVNFRTIIRLRDKFEYTELGTVIGAQTILQNQRQAKRRLAIYRKFPYNHTLEGQFELHSVRNFNRRANHTAKRQAKPRLAIPPKTGSQNSL